VTNYPVEYPRYFMDQLANKIIDYLNAKSSQELITLDISDRIAIVLEISKMVQKNMYKRQREIKLDEVKESIASFNSNFDKRTRLGLATYWDQHGNLISWEKYETLLVEAKRKINSSHENIVVLNGSTIVNYLQRDLQFLWLIKTLFTGNTSYTKLINLRMAYNRMLKCLVPDLALWKKFQGLITRLECSRC